MNDRSGREIVKSKLLILQSKRLLLSSAQRRLDQTGLDSMRRRVDRLRVETDMAQFGYRTAMLDYGSPQHSDYWIVAYGRLIEMASALSGKLRDSVVSLPIAERFQASADVEMLEEIISHWSRSMRTAIAKSVA